MERVSIPSRNRLWGVEDEIGLVVSSRTFDRLCE
jgi:hypothetical protein